MAKKLSRGHPMVDTRLWLILPYAWVDLNSDTVQCVIDREISTPVSHRENFFQPNTPLIPNEICAGFVHNNPWENWSYWILTGINVLEKIYDCILISISFRIRSCSILSSMDALCSLLSPIELTIRCTSLWYLNENEILMTRTGPLFIS